MTPSVGVIFSKKNISHHQKEFFFFGLPGEGVENGEVGPALATKITSPFSTSFGPYPLLVGTQKQESGRGLLAHDGPSRQRSPRTALGLPSAPPLYRTRRHRRLHQIIPLSRNPDPQIPSESAQPDALIPRRGSSSDHRWPERRSLSL